MKTSPSQAKGFTLIELLVVLVLAVSIAGIGVTAFSSGDKRHSFESSFSTLLKTIREKRNQSIKTQSITLWDASKHSLPEKLTLSWDFGKNKNILQFFPSGSNTGGSITLHQDTRQRQITVNWLTGRIDAE